MPTRQSVLEDLKSKGNEKTRIIYIRHGLPGERTFGVSMADLKLIAKSIKGQQTLAYELYESGNVDAMYLAGLVANGALMTKDQLRTWALGAADMPMICEYTVPWVTLESKDASSLATEWIASGKDHLATIGWCTYSGIVATSADSALDMEEIKGLLATAIRQIPHAGNRVKHTMNGFVIAVGTYVAPLIEEARAAAQTIGVVTVDMGDTSCKVPLATAAIAKNEAAGKLGQKRRTMRC